MKYSRLTAGMLAVLAVVCCMHTEPAFSEYAFDDLDGASGKSYQWMIINKNGETFGDTHSNALDVSGDLLTTDNPVLNVTSGTSATTVNDRSLKTMFLVVAEGQGSFDMNFRAPDTSQQFDVSTQNLNLSTNTLEANSLYTDTKTPLGNPDYPDDPLWAKYGFLISRYRNTGVYDSVLQYFYFQQNPANSPSLGIPVPFVIANVKNAIAATEPLELRLALRDSTNMDGNIAAYDLIKWRVNEDYPSNGQDSYMNSGQWVFIPVDNLDNIDNSRIDRLLTTEVTNHTAVRYAAYDGATANTWIYPLFWKFDLVRTQGMTDVPRQFKLANSSHIAPGLVTVYRRAFNVNEDNKRPLQLFAVDDSIGTGVYGLRLNHRIIYGRRLSDKYSYPASEGGFNLFEVTAFAPRLSSMTFYNDVAQRTGASVAVPSTASLNSSTVKHNFMPSEALSYFTIDQTIPNNLRTSTTEGMLPLHITFNIPITQINSRTGWNNIVAEWRRSGNIADIFAQYFNIYLLTTTDGELNPWNLTQELQKEGVYPDQVKVFIDEDRGRITQDNDRGLITVSFIVMLMNGTKDGERPMLRMVQDKSITQDDNYIAIRDGNADNKWNMTFFIAPANYIINPEKSGETISNSNSGGGGCNAGMFGLLAGAIVIFAAARRERR